MDKQNRIIAQAKRLPIDSRRIIVDAILDSIARDEGKILAVERLAQLIPIGEEVFGVTYDERRKANGDAYIRNICAKVMRGEGYTFSAIGRAMKRHPTSVMSMVHRADEMASGFFGKEYQKSFNEFISKL